LSSFFVDTSALTKRCVLEIGSKWVVSWIEPVAGHTVFISTLATVETVSALTRRERERIITVSDRVKLQNDFLFHVQNQYSVINLDDNIMNLARSLLVQHQLRTLDALQLASASQTAKILGIQLTFICADTRLLAAAAAEGLLTDNPNAHP
jgi:uncharacterized protein